MRFPRFLCLLPLFVVCTINAHPKPLDGVAVIVNNAIITKSELANEIDLIEKQLRHSGKPVPEHQALEKQVLDHMVMKKTQLQMAERTGILIDEPTLDSTIGRIAKDNNLSLTQFREALAAEGMDFEQYRNTIRNQMIISQLQQRDVLHSIQVSEQEVNQFIQSPNGLGNLISEYRLGHILIPLPESPTPEELKAASQKAQGLHKELQHGKSLEEVAIRESKGETALEGGDLGWRKLAELPTIFEKVVPTLGPKDTATPIRSASGFHIIQLLEKRNAAFDDALVSKTLVRHILLKTNTLTSNNEAKRRLTKLRERILEGEDFDQIAKAHSADMASASNGGSLGWVTKEVLVPEFSRKMDTLALNKLSEPFKTPLGWHIMEVQERKTLTHDETALRQKAREMIQQRKYQEKLQTWAQQLRDEAYVKSYMDNHG